MRLAAPVLFAVLGGWQGGVAQNEIQVHPGAAGATPALRSNVLLVLADDLGVDQLASYGEGTDLAYTPVLDGLAARGMQFRNAWSNPNCSPTRAGILTGRHAFRHGIGTIINYLSGPAFPPSEVILPELLDLAGDRWAHALIGKWHLGNPNNGGLLSVNIAGFDHFDGSMCSLEPSPPFGYYNWERVIDGTEQIETGYNTTVTVDAALAWIQDAPEPWFCFVSMNAPHGPFHAPPPELHTEVLAGLPPPTQQPRPYYKAMIEAMDAELGRLFDGIDTAGPVLTVFLADNGTPKQVPVPPFTAAHAKGTVYEGGVNVPLIFAGWDTIPPGSECQALVQTSDLFATLLDVAGIDASQLAVTHDSLSLLPLLSDPEGPGPRPYAFTEFFSPLGAPTSINFERAIRDDQYKLLRLGPEVTEFYDLIADPFETNDLLLGPLTPEQQTAFSNLTATLSALLTSD